ncbi:Os11g0222680 [Oryza sativa Japonica Group]|uniref:Os11g0222680 protein n=1 Tax=Oryza sativa subsp. japonica TaxID=39947 RepID=A0A0P0Y0I5_ORYSJ|nr:Os11g0222680 [Oryza sativa Japonica Group]
MEKVFSGYALFFVLFLTGSTIGGCFPTVEELAVHGWIPPDDGATEYYGLEATMDVYGFNLEHGQQTGGFIWIYNSDETPAANVIHAGWNVDPESYNDSQTHFTTSWFVEESKKGCLDMRCPGFQRTGGSHPFVPGQDQNSGDWEIYFGFDGKAKLATPIQLTMI